MARTKKNKGVGDVVQSITNAIGIEPCEGCQKRKDALNVLFPFGSPKQMSEEQRQWYSDFIRLDNKVITDVHKPVLLEIYNDLFGTDLQSTQDNIVNMVSKKLELIYGQE